jgi:hypothetical protein
MLTVFGDRVSQLANFDSVYNGKEVTAYLQHIVSRYDSLADQTVFLHSVPNAHLYFGIFLRAIRWAEMCRSEVDFLHLNANYKTGIWGQCCGKKGACRASTWDWLFPLEAETPEQEGDVSSSTTLSSIADAPNGDATKVKAKSSFKKVPVGTYSSAQFSASGRKLATNC